MRYLYKNKGNNMAVPRSRNSHSKQNSKRAHLGKSEMPVRMCVCGKKQIRSHTKYCNNKKCRKLI